MRAVLPATAASAGAPAATTAAEATAAAAAAPIATAATRAWGLRLFDLDRPAVEVRAVEAANGLLGFLGSRHLDEPEASRTPGVPVGHDTRGLDAADRRESFAQALVGGAEGQTAYQEFDRHVWAPSWRTGRCEYTLVLIFRKLI